MSRILVAAIILIATVATFLAPGNVTSVNGQTEGPGIQTIAGVEIVPLGDVATVTDPALRVRVGLQRFVFAPGGVLDIHFAGPVVMLVESGELEVTVEDNGRTFFLAPFSDGQFSRRDEQRLAQGKFAGDVTLFVDQSMSVTDGDVGLLRNVTDESASVLVISVAPLDGSGQSPSTPEGGEQIAVPDPTKAP